MGWSIVLRGTTVLSHKYFQLELGGRARLTNYVTAQMNFADRKQGQKVVLRSSMLCPMMFDTFLSELRDGMHRCNRELCWGTTWDIPRRSMHPFGTGETGWNRDCVRHTMGHPLIGHKILRYGMDRWDWELHWGLHWGTPWDIPSWHSFMSHGISWRLRDGMEGWRDGRDGLWWPRLCMCGKTPHHGTIKKHHYC